MTDGQTDGQTDGRMDGRTDRQTQGEKQYVSHPLQGGDISNQNYKKLNYIQREHYGQQSEQLFPKNVATQQAKPN